MRCAQVLARLSAWRDGELDDELERAVELHVQRCPECGEVWEGMCESLDALTALTALSPPEPIARRVAHQLEVERRGPGLALLFRSTWAARPLMVPSLIQASLVFATLLAVGVALEARQYRLATAPPPVAGSPANPLAVLGDVPMPRLRAQAELAERLLTSVGEGNLFVETVVASDGRVLMVRVIDGDSEGAQPLLDAMMHARFEPIMYRGRRVAVSFYRLISRAEVVTDS